MSWLLGGDSESAASCHLGPGGRAAGGGGQAGRGQLDFQCLDFVYGGMVSRRGSGEGPSHSFVAAGFQGLTQLHLIGALISSQPLS